MRMVDIIEKKRDGHQLTSEEIQFIINGYTDGSIPDYQVSAFLMAVLPRYDRRRNYTNDVSNGPFRRNCGSFFYRRNQSRQAFYRWRRRHYDAYFSAISCQCRGQCSKMSGRGLGYTGGTLIN